MSNLGIREKNFDCSTCHENFSSRNALDEHKTIIHPGGERASWEKQDGRKF